MKKSCFVFVLIFSFTSTLLFAAELVPVPTDVKADAQKVALGEKLFFDKILSKDKTLSCVSCHKLQHNGADNRQYTEGIDGQVGLFNVPTVYNAVYNFRQFWDGRAKDLAEQAIGPIENPVEMGNSFENLIQTLDTSKYKKQFDALYPDGITKQNIVHAIAEYEKALITPNAPFDQYLRGDKAAISPKAKEGYALFKSKGCIACHHGQNIGGNLYNKFGVIENAKSSDLGRYNITKKARDKYFFKVPSLRNISQTAPYFHDGRTSSLTEAVKLMARYQLGQPITKDEVGKIVTFLNSLTGEIPAMAKK